MEADHTLEREVIRLRVSLEHANLMHQRTGSGWQQIADYLNLQISKLREESTKLKKENASLRVTLDMLRRSLRWAAH